MYNVVDGFDVELADELIKVRAHLAEKIQYSLNYADYSMMVIAYAIARKK